MSDIKDHYPSPREAIFGNGHVANAWCALKYISWHLLYAFLAVCLGLLSVGIKVGDSVSERIPLRGARRITEGIRRGAGWIHSGLTHSRVKSVAALLIGVLGVISLVASIVAVVLMFIDQPIQFIVMLGIIIVLCAAAVLVIHVGKHLRKRFTSAGKAMGDVVVPVQQRTNKIRTRARDTTAVRRVYGYCPVSMDVEPKWFERVDDGFSALLNDED